MVEKKLAVALAETMKRWTASKAGAAGAYEVELLVKTGDRLPNFHQWVEGKEVVDGFWVGKRGEEGYYLLFIDWHRNENYYLALYQQDKKTTVAELQRVVDEGDGLELIWKYNPLKRDGKNEQRKAYFQQKFGSTTVRIPLPSSPCELELFFDRLFSLARNRQNADRIVTVFEL